MTTKRRLAVSLMLGVVAEIAFLVAFVRSPTSRLEDWFPIIGWTGAVLSALLFYNVAFYPVEPQHRTRKWAFLSKFGAGICFGVVLLLYDEGDVSPLFWISAFVGVVLTLCAVSFSMYYMKYHWKEPQSKDSTS